MKPIVNILLFLLSLILSLAVVWGFNELIGLILHYMAALTLLLFLAAVMFGCVVVVVLVHIVSRFGLFISSINPYKKATKWIVTPIAILYGLMTFFLHLKKDF